MQEQFALLVRELLAERGCGLRYLASQRGDELRGCERDDGILPENACSAAQCARADSSGRPVDFNSIGREVADLLVRAGADTDVLAMTAPSVERRQVRRS